MMVREKMLVVRMNEEEEERLIKLAKKLGTNQSAVVRALIYGAKVEEVSQPTVVLRQADVVPA